MYEYTHVAVLSSGTVTNSKTTLNPSSRVHQKLCKALSCVALKHKFLYHRLNIRTPQLKLFLIALVSLHTHTHPAWLVRL